MATRYELAGNGWLAILDDELKWTIQGIDDKEIAGQLKESLEMEMEFVEINPSLGEPRAAVLQHMAPIFRADIAMPDPPKRSPRVTY